MPSPAQPASDRPVSRNPFLANFEQDTSTPQQSSPVRGRKPMGEGTMSSQPRNAAMNNDDLELFVGLHDFLLYQPLLMQK